MAPIFQTTVSQTTAKQMEPVYYQGYIKIQPYRSDSRFFLPL